MIEKLFRSARVRTRMAASHLGIILFDFALALHERGHALGGLQCHVEAVEHFSRWMKARSLEVGDLNESTVDRFLRLHLPRCRCPRPAPKAVAQSRSALRCLLVFLRQRRTIPEAPTASTPAEDLLSRYRDHMERVAGLVESTREDRIRHAREFLRWRFGLGKIQLQRLKPGDLSGFMLHRAPELKPGSIRALATGLRSFARFLDSVGQADERLAGGVTCPPPWPRSPLPETFSEAELRVFLRSFDRNTRIGRRDFAMALCLCRLGLRAQEVASLRLEDLNWSGRSMHLRDTKTRRARVLPLPPDLAKAIKSYILHGRPLTQAKGLFVRHLAPIREASGSSLVLRAMRRAFGRSGLSRTRVHLLRHTFATRLHRRGVNIKEIADLLGHQSLETTGCYTRVNLEELRQVVLPWPEGWR